MILAIVIAAGAFAIFGCSSRSDEPPRPPLRAALRVEGATLVVKDDDHQDWNNIRVEVNDKFKCRLDHLDEGASGRIPLASCITDDGARFIPLTMAPVRVYVTAVLVSDTGQASGLFTFER
jgi:hypothetical protein